MSLATNLLLVRRAEALATASIFSVFMLTSCGESLGAQCTDVKDILNQSSSQMLLIENTADRFSQNAAIADKTAKELTALDLADDKLSNLRSHLTASYRKSFEASTAMDAVVEQNKASQTAELEALFTDFEAVVQEFEVIAEATLTYCNGGTVASELTDAPPQ